MGNYLRTPFSCVYALCNEVAGKAYIGSSKFFIGRVKDHLSALKQNKHKNQILQNAWNKYGGDVFELHILEIVDNQKELRERERYWIDECNTLHPNGYNLTSYTGNNHDNFELSVFVREKIKLIHSNPKFKEIHRKAVRESLNKPDTKQNLA